MKELFIKNQPMRGQYLLEHIEVMKEVAQEMGLRLDTPEMAPYNDGTNTLHEPEPGKGWVEISGQGPEGLTDFWKRVDNTIKRTGN
ncbi:MAG: hypothetical protein H6774_02730 [Pseudomonadales bacterium]|nr:hypothetical protein [Candidatus Woesebacteria bacterium]MCB9801980.1 hypothetical protein [Pseudomonadales bacterium]